MFSEQNFEWLKIVECLKKSGLTIEEIKLYRKMKDRGDDESIVERLELLKGRREAIQKQIDELHEKLKLLDLKCWYYETALKEGTTKRVFSLSVDELPEEHREAKKKLMIIKGEK